MINRNSFLRFILICLLGIIYPSFKSLNEEKRLPKILILGDSISIGYFPFIEKSLVGIADIRRPMLPNGGFENCGGTSKALKHIYNWIGETNWDLIHFNFGLHDIKHVNPVNGKNSNSFNDPHQASPEQYEDNLEKIVEILKKTGAKLIFATTTPYPHSKLKPARKPGMHKIYNQIALGVMKKHKVKINDLHSFVLPRMNELQRPNNVHFSEYGSKELAKVVVKSILENL